MESEEMMGVIKLSSEDIPQVHSSQQNRPKSSPHVSSEPPIPSTSGLQKNNGTDGDSMRKNEEAPVSESEKENDGALSDWLSGGPMGTKGAVLVFRSCVLASRTPSIDSPTRSIGNNTGTAILLNKAKKMAKRLVADPHSFSVRPKNIMHDVMETFGNANKYAGQAYVVRHVSEAEMPEAAEVEEQGHEPAERKRGIDDVLNDLDKITLKKHLNIENTTANIKPAEDPPPVNAKDTKEDKKSSKKCKKKDKRKIGTEPRPASPAGTLDSDDSELVKVIDNVKVLESSRMPARLLKLSYKLVNTETKLLSRLLQAHGLNECPPDRNDCSLLWAGLHHKPDVLRSLSVHQRVNHFPRSYELTRKDKLFKNIEKMQYFRGLKHFDFIPTTFLMPQEYKELCTTHYRTKGPWIVKPAASSRGRGIYIVNTPEQIPKGENVVVAKYIDRPLLIGGHKCDLRLYVCVTSIDPLLIYMYEEGLVRFATVKYDNTNKNLWNPCMHLCNYSINKYHTDYIKCSDASAGTVGHKWSLSGLLRVLRREGRDTALLMSRVEEVVVKAVLCAAQTMASAARAFVPHFNNCFELFGYDILIDDTLKPWLLEINLSPSLACDSPLDARVKSALIADTLTLVGIPAVTNNNEGAGNNSLKMRIGACRRVHSAENVCNRNKPPSNTTTTGGSTTTSGLLPLSGEELRMVRAVRAQYARRGGYVRIFPSHNSWQKYSQYLDPVSGIPVCSTSLNNNIPYQVVQHNYNLLIHSYVLPHFQHKATAVSMTDTPERLIRYEAVTVTGAAPAVCLATPTAPPRDGRRDKQRVQQLLKDGMTLTIGEYRRAFGLYLSHVLKRLSTSEAAPLAALVNKFLKRAAVTLRMPYNVQSPPSKMCDKDRCAVVAKQLNDFLYMYYRETDLYTDSDDKDGCVANIHFAQFLFSASEAELEEVLLTAIRLDDYVVRFVGDGRGVVVDMPAARLQQLAGTTNGTNLTTSAGAKHALLRMLACITPANVRRYSKPRTETDVNSKESEESKPLTLSSSVAVLKDSLRQEKPLTQALKFARS